MGFLRKRPAPPSQTQTTVFFRVRLGDPSVTYGQHDAYVRYCQNVYIDRCSLTKLFLAEHALRELTQREERLHHKVMALQKAVAIGSDVRSDATNLEDAQTQLETARAQYPGKAQALFQAEYMLPSSLKA
ncbi:uncharacterized protein N7515_008263 [Penicillium bovifimosum]|uniref:Uncharacterized protein n=1 Tax=Penicillium bovifimosum TaxID=126998 RepID=A0A9W9GMY2_9EURO|nr:uncharacterized protein N7515_008263 [Penicillium bovifimosum]KAJ5124438.1 hypothetical protein N7515_008263 [Penicillium bovifimosum]